jgi:spore coat protein A
VQIGSDGGLLNVPITLNQMLLAPGERKDVIIDFSHPALWGQKIVLKNNARSPYPKGEVVDPQITGQIMAFNVVIPLLNTDNSNVPSLLRQTPITRLGMPDNIRQLLLMETEDEFDRLKTQLGTSALGPLDWEAPITENPMLNALEEWQIINFTPDAHPIHLHLVNFQVVSRQKFNTGKYIPGNPSSLQVIGMPRTPDAGDQGWKDTEIMYPGEVTSIRARFDLGGLYVWHCHILSHEDHEMMRPFYVGKMAPALAAKMPPHPVIEKIADSFFNISALPNPFNNVVNIRMEVRIAGHYVVEIINSLGQRVAVLSNMNYQKGIYNLHWDGMGSSGNRLHNGTYYVHSAGADRARSIKLVLYR